MSEAKTAHGKRAHAEISNDTKSPELQALAAELENRERALADLDTAWEGGAADRRAAQERFAAENELRRREDGNAGAQSALQEWVAVAVEIEQTAALQGQLAARERDAAIAYQNAVALVRQPNIREQLLMDRVIYRGEVAKLTAAVIDPHYHYSVHEDVAIADNAKARTERMSGAVANAFGIRIEKPEVQRRPVRPRAAPKKQQTPEEMVREMFPGVKVLNPRNIREALAVAGADDE